MKTLSNPLTHLDSRKLLVCSFERQIDISTLLYAKRKDRASRFRMKYPLLDASFDKKCQSTHVNANCLPVDVLHLLFGTEASIRTCDRLPSGLQSFPFPLTRRLSGLPESGNGRYWLMPPCAYFFALLMPCVVPQLRKWRLGLVQPPVVEEGVDRPAVALEGEVVLDGRPGKREG